jgi:hypothetical protein
MVIRLLRDTEPLFQVCLREPQLPAPLLTKITHDKHITLRNLIVRRLRGGTQYGAGNRAGRTGGLVSRGAGTRGAGHGGSEG